ncbi:MAG: PLP-dependent aminotransferase family protein [Paracoccaceae bacterium]
MTIWPPSPDRLKRPIYRSIAQAFIEAVAAGEFKNGMRLPPHRRLAYDLGVSIHTISRAYEELTRIGLIKGEVGRGSYVTAGSAEVGTPWQAVGESEQVIDLSMLVPVRSAWHDERMRDALRALAEDLPISAYSSFRPRTTLRSHCDAAQIWLQQHCGLDVPRERILPTNGCTTAMTVALMTAAVPGDVILTEDLGHHTIKALGRSLGLRMKGVAMDAEGLLPQAVHDAATKGATAIFVMPSGLSPTTAFMSEARRLAIVEVARKCDLLIIENDAWGPVMKNRPPPLAALAPERTLYLTGLSKLTVAGMRIGWLVVPDRLVTTSRTRHLVTSWMATPLIAEIATRWINDGTASDMLRFQQEQFTRRNRLARKILGHLDLRSGESGMHVWLNLPEDWSAPEFVAHARNERVAIGASANFQVSDNDHPNGVRICLGATSERDLAEGLRILSTLAQSTQEPAVFAL